jgi:hypothetical protein
LISRKKFRLGHSQSSQLQLPAASWESGISGTSEPTVEAYPISLSGLQWSEDD